MRACSRFATGRLHARPYEGDARAYEPTTSSRHDFPRRADALGRKSTGGYAPGVAARVRTEFALIRLPQRASGPRPSSCSLRRLGYAPSLSEQPASNKPGLLRATWALTSASRLDEHHRPRAVLSDSTRCRQARSLNDAHYRFQRSAIRACSVRAVLRRFTPCYGRSIRSQSGASTIRRPSSRACSATSSDTALRHRRIQPTSTLPRLSCNVPWSGGWASLSLRVVSYLPALTIFSLPLADARTDPATDIMGEALLQMAAPPQARKPVAPALRTSNLRSYDGTLPKAHKSCPGKLPAEYAIINQCSPSSTVTPTAARRRTRRISAQACA